ncbi:MAG TPA: DHA2 family efflux MFS transporter permease subunit, partial [Polyangiaceae bacterium]
NATSINVALDRLMERFAAPLSTVQWIVTGYLLALALVLPSFRWIVERLGSRRLYVACLLGFTATSTLCACAWSAESLIVFRVLQGAVGGLLTPLAQTLAAQLAGPKRMGRAISIMSMPVLVAPLLGPTLAGFILQRLSWRWLFLFNVPLGVAGAWLAHRHLPSAQNAKRTRLDFVGLLLLSPGIGLFTYAVSRMGHEHSFSRTSLGVFALAGGLVVAFVLDAWRRPDTALIDLRLFRHAKFDAALAAYLLTSFGEFGAQLILPLYYQQVRGESALSTGLLLAPQGVGMLLTLPQAGRLTDRIDNGKIVIAGVLITLLGTYAFMQVTDHSSYVILSLALVLRGAGLGATAAPAMSAAYKHLSREEIPNGTAAINIVQRLGAPLGTATMAMTLQWFLARLPGTRAPLASAFAHTFIVSAALSGLALFAGLVLARNATQPIPNHRGASK